MHSFSFSASPSSNIRTAHEPRRVEKAANLLFNANAFSNRVELIRGKEAVRVQNRQGVCQQKHSLQ